MGGRRDTIEDDPMRYPFTLLTGALALVALTGAGSAADGPPTLDVKATCKSDVRAEASVSDNSTVEGCLRSEEDARKEAQRRWGDYSSAAKSQCEKQFQAGGYPSYVEMVTCLELASGTVPTQGTGPGADKSSGARREKADGNAGAVTAEPRPSQRTNPIEVLEKP
ncbi:hypothetical protein [Methylobacterium sp. 77]|uniref:hypothetical protein n=1 Tax=Methylobacterium sp. 77 TaxID=1101192 RepID=UPI0003683C56|nr:hypothetical protein [Methylobacterium sp. 77]